MNLPATQIDLDAEISVSELRSEELFDRRLQAHSALRLRRRNDLLGVIVSTERWKSIEETIRHLSAALEQLEDAATSSLSERRVSEAKYAPVTDESWTDVEKRYTELTRDAADIEFG